MSHRQYQLLDALSYHQLTVGRRFTVGRQSSFLYWRNLEGEVRSSFLYWRNLEGEDRFSFLYWRNLEGEDRFSFLYWRNLEGKGAGVSTTASHYTCPTSHVPLTTDTVPSSATTKALSEAGMHVLCDTPHVTS